MNGRFLVTAIAALMLVAGCGDDDGGDRSPENALTLDWRRGTFDRVALDQPIANVLRAHGKPGKRGQEEPAQPIGEDYYDIGGPTSFGSAFSGPRTRDETVRYKALALFTGDGRVYGWVTTSARAETPEGVGVGDNRDIVERRYPKADCYIGNEGSEYVTFPLCEVRVCDGRLLAFGGDPIRSIWLIAETRTGLSACRKVTPVTSDSER